MILRTVSDAIRLDIEEMLSAVEMWQYALDLRDDANAAEMAGHVALVSSLVYEAKLAEFLLHPIASSVPSSVCLEKSKVHG